MWLKTENKNKKAWFKLETGIEVGLNKLTNRYYVKGAGLYHSFNKDNLLKSLDNAIGSMSDDLRAVLEDLGLWN